MAVYVNDGRHHLQMQPPGSYDLIALEPPPIGYAGVAALYSEEFYQLARTRLTPKGFISQWLPSYQVPTATTLSMIRAFVDVFPQSVLLSGAQADLILIGAKDRIEIDPNRLFAALSQRPGCARTWQRLDLGTPREIVGMFLGSAGKLADATRDAVPVTDDRPVQEYGVRSLLNLGEFVPGSVVDLAGVAAWCPACFDNGEPVRVVEGLDLYLALLNRAYSATPEEGARARHAGDEGRRVCRKRLSWRRRARDRGRPQRPGDRAGVEGADRPGHRRVQGGAAPRARFGADPLASRGGAGRPRGARRGGRSTCADPCSSTPPTRMPGTIWPPSLPSNASRSFLLTQTVQLA